MHNLIVEELLKNVLAKIQALEKENAQFRAKLNMNSSKLSGGHKGSTLNKVNVPNFIVDLELYSCSHCKSTLENTKIDDIKTRQVFDIPDINIFVTEYRFQVKTCSHCQKKSYADFPSNVTHVTQYGANIKALITNLNIY